MNEREGLIKEIGKLCNGSNDSGDTYDDNDIADFILAREKRILDEIEKPLSMSIMFQEHFDDSLGLTEARKALSIIHRHMEVLK